VGQRIKVQQRVYCLTIMTDKNNNQDGDVLYLQKENLKLKDILRQCLKARQIAHVKQIIREALTKEI
jgi:uncharacterized protein YdcH (DUF465 family)